MFMLFDLLKSQLKCMNLVC